KSLIDGTSFTCGISVHSACSAFLTRSWYTFHSYASIAMLNSDRAISQNSTGFIFGIAMAYFIRSSYFHCVTRFLLHRPPCYYHHLLRSPIRIHRPSLPSTLCTSLHLDVRLDRMLLLLVHKVHLVFYRSAILFAAS